METISTNTSDPGITARTISIIVKGDTLDEADERLVVNLSAPTNATIADAQGQITIGDDDSPPSLSIADPTITEGNSGTSTLNFTVALSAASGQTVSVAYATGDGTAVAPSDYTAGSGTLSISAGSLSKNISIPIVGDTLDEIDEQFVLNLSAPTNATIADAQAVATIRDNDGPTITITDASVNESNSGTVSVELTVQLSASSVQPVTVTYATANGTASAPTDYTSIPATTLSFAPSQTQRVIALTVAGDLLNEADEYFVPTNIL